jgi:hypothetical protein
MKTHKQHHKIIFILSFVIAFSQCKKEYDQVPLKVANDGARLSIKKMKERLKVNGTSVSYRFKGGDTNLYCMVISDEVSGNFYQQIFIRDEAGDAIQMNITESGGIYIGDHIRINLNQVSLVLANNMVYLDSVNIAKSVVKLSSGNTLVPKQVSVAEILSYSASPTNSASLQSQLVQLNGVEFRPNTLLPTFADAIGKTSANQTLTTCEPGEWLTVRSSGRSNFAGKILPAGNGSIVGIISQYNSTMQLIIRSYDEVTMNGPLCSSPTNTLNSSAFLYKDFNDYSITSGDWTSYSVLNSNVVWSVSSFSNSPSPFAKISGFVGSTNTISENWLISPIINLSAAIIPILSFQTAAKFPGTVLEVLVSTNYVSGNPSSSSWTSLAPNYALSPAPSSGGYVWTPSGNVSLSLFKSSSLRLAFKYKSTSSGATTYELDDVVVKEKQ